MQKNYSAKSKILKKSVLGIAIYLITFFSALLLLSSFAGKIPYASILINTLALFIASLVSIITLGSDDRQELFSDKSAVFFGKFYFVPFVILSVFSLTVTLNYLFSLIPWEKINLNNVSQDNDSLYSFPIYILILAYAFLIPFSEETLFRVLIFFRLKKIIAFPAAAVLSGIMFGIYHGNLMQGLYGFIMGTIFCLVMHYGGSFFFALLMHSAANLISVLCYSNETVCSTIYSPFVIILSFIYIVVAVTLSITLKNKLTKKDKHC